MDLLPMLSQVGAFVVLAGAAVVLSSLPFAVVMALAAVAAPKYAPPGPDRRARAAAADAKRDVLEQAALTEDEWLALLHLLRHDVSDEAVIRLMRLKATYHAGESRAEAPAGTS